MSDNHGNFYQEEDEFVSGSLSFIEELFSKLLIRKNILSDKSIIKLQDFKQKCLRFFDAFEREEGNVKFIRENFATQCNHKDFRVRQYGSGQLTAKLSEDSQYVSTVLWKQCSYCKKSGHEFQNCRRLLGQCLRCGSDEHFIRVCPLNYRTTVKLQNNVIRPQSPHEIVTGESKQKRAVLKVHCLPLKNKFDCLIDECRLKDAELKIDTCKTPTLGDNVNDKEFDNLISSTANAKCNDTSHTTPVLQNISAIESTHVSQCSSMVFTLDFENVLLNETKSGFVGECGGRNFHTFEEKCNETPKKRCKWITPELVEEFEYLQKKMVLYEKFVNDSQKCDQALENALNRSFDADCPSENSHDNNSVSTLPCADRVEELRTEYSLDSGVDYSDFFVWLGHSLQAQLDNVDRVKTITKLLNDTWLTDVNDILSLGTIEDTDLGNANGKFCVLNRMHDHLSNILDCVEDIRTDKNSSKWKNLNL